MKNSLIIIAVVLLVILVWVKRSKAKEVADNALADAEKLSDSSIHWGKLKAVRLVRRPDYIAPTPSKTSIVLKKSGTITRVSIDNTTKHPNPTQYSAHADPLNPNPLAVLPSVMDMATGDPSANNPLNPDPLAVLPYTVEKIKKIFGW